MTDTVRLWMQEKLDGVLAQEQEHMLLQELETDEEAAEEYARLAQVDQVLARAPMLRASNRLAATIMARLAMELQKEVELEQMPEHVRQAFLLSLSLVSLATMPMMVASSWMLLNRQQAKALEQSIETAVALEVLLLRALIFLLHEVEQHIERDPQKAQFILSTLPVVFGGMLETLLPQDNNEDDVS
jgi:anti-sigma factor RsiW